jgi:rSAM/selenodomain-associated transferase 2
MPGDAAPAVSVVIPTLNEEGVIAACLGSVGDDADVEVVISDGGSHDRTLERALAARPGVRVVEGPPGRGGQLARGAAVARGAVVVFLHADCRLPAGWRPAVTDALAAPAAAIGCFRLRTEAPGGSGAARAWWRLLDLRGRGWGLPYGDQALFLRRATLEEVGGVPDQPLMEDVELVRRCLRRGRLTRVPLEVRTTARRFARRPLRARLCTATFPTLYRLGVPPAALARWYGEGR